MLVMAAQLQGQASHEAVLSLAAVLVARVAG